MRAYGGPKTAVPTIKHASMHYRPDYDKPSRWSRRQFHRRARHVVKRALHG